MEREIDPVIWQGADGQLRQAKDKKDKRAGEERVVLLHSPRESCVFFDPFDEYMKSRGTEPRYSDCLVLDLKEYTKLANIYGGEVIGPGWFPRHVSSQTRGGATKGLLGAMNRCERAIDDLLATLVLL